MGESVLVVDDQRFDAHRASEAHPERPERLEAARAGLEAVLPPPAGRRVPVRHVTDEEAGRVHAPSYLTQLRERLGAGSGWGHIDADTFFSPGTEDAAWLAAGGAVDLCRALAGGPARRGVALLRPPGHHAGPSRAMGFCLLNNIAIAAADALANGLDRVAIVDWDVHHGNGTQDIFWDDPRALFVSLHQSPLYPGTGSREEQGGGEGLGYTVNIPMPAGSGPPAYGEAFREVVLPILRAFEAELVLVSCGLDAHRRDPLAGIELDASCFAAMTTALRRHVDELGHGRLGLLLEGGYDLDAIEASIAASVAALQGEEAGLPREPLSPIQERSVSLAKDAARAHWPI